MSQLVAPCDAGQNLEFASAFGGTARAGHDGGEALRPLMEGGELPAGLAVDDGIGLFHRILTCRGPRSASPGAGTDLPSMRSSTSLIAWMSPSAALSTSLRAISRSLSIAWWSATARRGLP